MLETGCGSTPPPDTAKALASQGQTPLDWPLAQTPLQSCPGIGISSMPASAERQRELRRMLTERRIADLQAAGYTARAHAVARQTRAGQKATRRCRRSMSGSRYGWPPRRLSALEAGLGGAEEGR